MSGSCGWCHRRRPSVVVEVDGVELSVCEHCKQTIEAQRELREQEKKDAKADKRAAARGG